MEASSGSAFITSCGMMNLLVPSILWLHMLVGGTEGPVPVRTWLVVLGGILKVFISTLLSRLCTFNLPPEDL